LSFGAVIDRRVLLDFFQYGITSQAIIGISKISLQDQLIFFFDWFRNDFPCGLAGNFSSKFDSNPKLMRPKVLFVVL
jgi:hypothetical protein